MTTLLFDIDGTLVRTGGAGKAAMEAALRHLFGIDEVYQTVKYSGRTDRAIGLELLTAHAVDPTPANRHALTEEYLRRLPSQLAACGGEVCPGVVDVLNAVHKRPDVRLGLLTGNVRRGAETKLSHFDLWKYFPAGGFGDEHDDRDDVARMALREVAAHSGKPVDPESVWVIGDTPLDVSCARAVGAKAVAVGTGWHSMEELAACAPDLLLKDLDEVDAVLKRWGLR